MFILGVEWTGVEWSALEGTVLESCEQTDCLVYKFTSLYYIEIRLRYPPTLRTEYIGDGNWKLNSVSLLRFPEYCVHSH